MGRKKKYIPHEWTIADLEFLFSNYRTMTNRGLARALKRPVTAILLAMKKWGLREISCDRRNKSRRALVFKMMRDPEATISEIQDKTGLSLITIRLVSFKMVPDDEVRRKRKIIRHLMWEQTSEKQKARQIQRIYEKREEYREWKRALDEKWKRTVEEKKNKEFSKNKNSENLADGGV